MFKVGINTTLHHASPLLVRILLRHPDVEVYILDDLMSYSVYDTVLIGEYPQERHKEEIPLESLDMYIGDMDCRIKEALAKNEKLKAIITYDSAEDANYLLGVPEYNRKALVRGARIVELPSVATTLTALALMPLAKNLLLNDNIHGTLNLYQIHEKEAWADSTVGADCFDIVETKILKELQTSFNSKAFLQHFFHNDFSTFDCAIFNVKCSLGIKEIQEIYHNFYDDHRHVVLTDGIVTSSMVKGTNKAVIALDKHTNDTLSITIGCDDVYKGEVGNIVHLMNLMFGLDERTGL